MTDGEKQLLVIMADFIHALTSSILVSKYNITSVICTSYC